MNGNYRALMLIVLCAAIGFMQAMQRPSMPEYELLGIPYKKNNFGDVLVQWENVSYEELTQKLSLFVEALKEKERGAAFFIDVSHEKAAILPIVKRAGFTLHHANSDKSEWILKNGATIPEPYTALGGAQVLVRKGDLVLVIEEKTRKGLLGFPAGTSEPHELARATAARELYEEVGLTVDPRVLKLVALFNRTRVNRYGASSYNHYYVVDAANVQGDINTQDSEIARALWVPLAEIAAQKTIDGLTVSPAIAALAQQVLDDNRRSHVEYFVDYRQLSKPENARDQKDTMVVEFFE